MIPPPPPPAEGTAEFVGVAPESFDPNLPFDKAQQLLAVAGLMLDTYGRGDKYVRRVVVQGGDPGPDIWAPGQDQLVASIGLVHMGRSGEQQFRSESTGAYGAYSFETLQIWVDVVNQWPGPRGGLSAELAPDSVLVPAVASLAYDARLVMNGFRMVSLGGIRTSPPFADGATLTLPGPFTPLPPHGLLAAWRLGFQIQLDQ